MAEYEIVPDGLSAYGVEVSWQGGSPSARAAVLEPDKLECKGVVTLGESKYDALYGGGGAMLTG
jgi:hypothetical protein